MDCRATGQKLSCIFEQIQSDNFAQINSRLNKGVHVRFKSNHVKDILNFFCVDLVVSCLADPGEARAAQQTAL